MKINNREILDINLGPVDGSGPSSFRVQNGPNGAHALVLSAGGRVLILVDADGMVHRLGLGETANQIAGTSFWYDFANRKLYVCGETYTWASPPQAIIVQVYGISADLASADYLGQTPVSPPGIKASQGTLFITASGQQIAFWHVIGTTTLSYAVLTAGAWLVKPDVVWGTTATQPGIAYVIAQHPATGEIHVYIRRDSYHEIAQIRLSPGGFLLGCNMTWLAGDGTQFLYDAATHHLFPLGDGNNREGEFDYLTLTADARRGCLWLSYQSDEWRMFYPATGASIRKGAAVRVCRIDADSMREFFPLGRMVERTSAAHGLCIDDTDGTIYFGLIPTPSPLPVDLSTLAWADLYVATSPVERVKLCTCFRFGPQQASGQFVTGAHSFSFLAKSAADSCGHLYLLRPSTASVPPPLSATVTGSLTLAAGTKQTTITIPATTITA